VTAGIPFESVLFDLDGTLIDSNDAHALSWMHALREHGIGADITSVRPLIGMGADKLLPALAGVDEQSASGQSMARRKKELFGERMPALRPTRGARQLLEHLLEHGRDVVIATSADEKEMAALLDRAGVADLACKRTSKDDAAASKPQPDIVCAALAKTRGAGNAVMIGDTPYDIEAAARAGVPSIALRCGGHWTDHDLRGALYVLDDPAALLEHWRDAARDQGGERSRT
jgi:HAD superfamily hydrolase (TIGR01509 family)